MLVILPPSEAKHPAPESGPPLQLDGLSFPELTPTRRRVIDALIATSRRPDAMRRLLVGPSLSDEVDRNHHLRELPTRRAVDTYAGPLYVGLDPTSWSPAVVARAERQVVIVSALWGALRPGDQIPPYRLHVCARLTGMDRLEPTWRSVLPSILAEAARSTGPIVDLRSPAYQAVGRPIGLAEETIMFRVRPSPGGAPHIGDVIAKRVRGEVAAHLLASPDDPEDPADVADALAARWPLDVEPPAGRRASWTMTLEAPAGRDITVARTDRG